MSHRSPDTVEPLPHFYPSFKLVWYNESLFEDTELTCRAERSLRGRVVSGSASRAGFGMDLYNHRA